MKKVKIGTATKAGLLERVTNIPIPYGDFKKLTGLLKTQMAVLLKVYFI